MLHHIRVSAIAEGLAEASLLQTVQNIAIQNHTKPYKAVQTIQNYTIQYKTYITIQNCTKLYKTTHNCTKLHKTVQKYTKLQKLYKTIYQTIQNCTKLYKKVYKTIKNYNRICCRCTCCLYDRRGCYNGSRQTECMLALTETCVFQNR